MLARRCDEWVLGRERVSAQANGRGAQQAEGLSKTRGRARQRADGGAVRVGHARELLQQQRRVRVRGNEKRTELSAPRRARNGAHAEHHAARSMQVAVGRGDARAVDRLHQH